MAALLGDHPNIVTMYDVGEEDGAPYIVSQLMPEAHWPIC
jgi:hypothetical protein